MAHHMTYNFPDGTGRDLWRTGRGTGTSHNLIRHGCSHRSELSDISKGPFTGYRGHTTLQENQLGRVSPRGRAQSSDPPMRRQGNIIPSIDYLPHEPFNHEITERFPFNTQHAAPTTPPATHKIGSELPPIKSSSPITTDPRADHYYRVMQTSTQSMNNDAWDRPSRSAKDLKPLVRTPPQPSQRPHLIRSEEPSLMLTLVHPR